ncbi:MAG: M20 family metallopeptidase [Planctomycetota bacterium]|nr:M20 family metallopeptidase [Planctomycetota bacterium]
MDSDGLAAFVDGVWEREIVPKLVEYIRIPHPSPAFDPDWIEHGHMEQAVELVGGWCRAQEIPGMTFEVVRLEGRTPLLFMEIPGQGDDAVLLYGHLDKQPEMVGWREGLGPWTPVLDGDRLYGRGGADDGYAAFASLTAIRALAQQGVPHARCVVIIEACEESGSYDLPHYIDHLRDRIGRPSLIVCLDSGAGDYERLWHTTSLRGMVCGDLRVEILREGVHSGDASGIVPDSFRLLREVLSRLEDPATGRVIPNELQAEIPTHRAEEAKIAADALGDTVYAKFPFVDGARPVQPELDQLVLNRTWRPALSITGAEGLPALSDAGNVLRPQTAVKVSLRLPPTLETESALAFVKRLLESDPPYGSRVTFHVEGAWAGWDAPPLATWLKESVARASETHFGKPPAYMGEGGSIPFMGMLGERFPEAQFLITGVLGPQSNAHGPNEFLHLPTGRKLTACVAAVLADHLDRPRS